MIPKKIELEAKIYGFQIKYGIRDIVVNVHATTNRETPGRQIKGELYLKRGWFSTFRCEDCSLEAVGPFKDGHLSESFADSGLTPQQVRDLFSPLCRLVEKLHKESQ